VGVDESVDLLANKSLTSQCVQSVINGSSESTGGTLLSSSDLAELPEDQLSWEAFFGKMASKGDLLGLGREEQIVVKQQMLDRLVQLERELQERTMTVSQNSVLCKHSVILLSQMHTDVKCYCMVTLCYVALC